MSGDGGSNDGDGQGGQPQGGQPQGGQPQGGQPQGGQPQGGQPQTQPQGGQPRAQAQGGQPAGGQYGGAQSTGIDTDLLQPWAIYGSILFAIAGLGVGLFMFLADTIDEPLVEASGSAGGSGMGAISAAASAVGAQTSMTMVPIIAVFIGVFVGVAIARDVDLDDTKTIQVAAVIMAAGTFIAFVLSAFLISTTLGDGLSLAFGGLLINSVIAAIVAAGVGAGGVWTERNQAPQ